MSIYCEFEGIKGDVTAAGFEGQINLSSFNFNVSRHVSMEPGNVANRESSIPQLSEITLTKGLDGSSPLLFKASVAAAAGKPVKLHFVRTADQSIQEYLRFELTDCVVSSYRISAQGAEGIRPREELKLSYSTIIISHTQYDKSNKVGTPVRCGYDLTAGKTI